MIAYFDTSALIPLLVAESGTPGAGRLWDEADRVVAARMLYAEARAVLAQAQRMDRLTAEGLREAVEGLDLLYGQLDRVEIDEHLVRRAGALAEHHALRGCDAIHLAAAERVADPDTVLVAGDRRLCDAAWTLGLNVSQL